MARRTVDKPLLFGVSALTILGFLIFSSASLGLLAREGARFSQVAFSQIAFGILLGGIALLVFSNINYRLLRPYAFPIFILSIFVTILVFIPGIGFEYGGANRWISIGLISFQPAEFLKLGFILYFAAWLSASRGRMREWRYDMFPLLLLLTLVGVIMLAQPDTGTLMIMAMAALAMFIAAGARFRDVLALGAIGIAALGTLAYARPYVMDRVLTFLNPSLDPLGVSYQLQQSLIAIGSGGLAGRGFGQSVQKFEYLPEPIGDSIFAVAAEEFGFLGAVLLIGFFLFIAYRSLRIAARAPDRFGGLVVVGIAILIVSQSFVNIASMVGVLPLTGLPLLFVSHGGSALMMALLEIGIVLNVSRYSKG